MPDLPDTDLPPLDVRSQLLFEPNEEVQRAFRQFGEALAIATQRAVEAASTLVAEMKAALDKVDLSALAPPSFVVPPTDLTAWLEPSEFSLPPELAASFRDLTTRH